MLILIPRRSSAAVFAIGLPLLLAACWNDRCEVVVINEAPSVGLAQRYFEGLMKEVNLAPDSTFKSGRAWRLVIVSAKPDQRHNDAGVDGSLRVDFEVHSPSSNVLAERCTSRFDECMVRIIKALPAQCRIPR